MSTWSDAIATLWDDAIDGVSAGAAPSPADYESVDDYAAALATYMATEKLKAWKAAFAAITPYFGGLEYLDHVNVSSAQQYLDFNGASGHGARQTELDGDADEIYEIDYTIVPPSGGALFTVRPNLTITSNQVYTRNLRGASTTNPEGTGLRFAYVGSSNRQIDGRLVLHAKSGVRRALRSNNTLHEYPDSTTGIWLEEYADSWDDTSTNISALRLYGDVASAWGVGSRAVLFRRRVPS